MKPSVSGTNARQPPSCEPRKPDATYEAKFWRRRPDLNRGWRFCRQGRIVYVVDSSCFLVGPTPPFSLVFGRYCSQIVPKVSELESPDVVEIR
jgi:hypothetical protein